MSWLGKFHSFYETTNIHPWNRYDEIAWKHATYIIAVYLTNQGGMRCSDTNEEDECTKYYEDELKEAYVSAANMSFWIVCLLVTIIINSSSTY